MKGICCSSHQKASTFSTIHTHAAVNCLGGNCNLVQSVRPAFNVMPGTQSQEIILSA